jgi:hypothetical protein
MSTQPNTPKLGNPTHHNRRQRAKALARRLKKLAQNFPEFSPILADPLFFLKTHSDRALVLHAIHDGAWAMEDLRRETKLPRGEIQKLLDALVAAQIIITVASKEKNPVGGRPKILYLPAPNLHP